MRRWVLWAPLAGFAVLALLVSIGLLRPADRTVMSRMVGKPVPALSLPPAVAGKPGLATADLRGEVRLVNLFASWCAPCIAEAPQLLALKQAGVRIDGIALRDARADITRFLADHGDPFDRIGDDPRSTAQLALGSSGVPESFVVDGAGVIRHQHVGPIMPQDMDAILAAIEDAR